MYISIPLPIRVSLASMLSFTICRCSRYSLRQRENPDPGFCSPLRHRSYASKSSFIQEGKGPGNEGRRVDYHPVLRSPISLLTVVSSRSPLPIYPFVPTPLLPLLLESISTCARDSPQTFQSKLYLTDRSRGLTLEKKDLCTGARKHR